MRIITGSARGARLQTLDGNDVRPTPERVKEALFSILQFRLEGRRFLDLFAGSGQIGLEALSRGAAEAVFVDASRASLEMAKKNAENTKLKDRAAFVLAEAEGYLRRMPGPFDLAFLDPPYSTGVLQRVLPKVAEQMADGGTIVCEHPAEEELPQNAGRFEKKKEYRYGKVMLTVYEKAEAEL
ncbi:MAG: 16S rRNA (guanine(966)-N(2))-methyltransferase RsmD [Clostridia bacterium]|nr:16S rRNA (guanine(966)-N(2))-methyltransferase RsmD [Clostridia bacterium]